MEIRSFALSIGCGAALFCLASSTLMSTTLVGAVARTNAQLQIANAELAQLKLTQGEQERTMTVLLREADRELGQSNMLALQSHVIAVESLQQQLDRKTAVSAPRAGHKNAFPEASARTLGAVPAR